MAVWSAACLAFLALFTVRSGKPESSPGLPERTDLSESQSVASRRFFAAFAGALLVASVTSLGAGTAASLAPTAGRAFQAESLLRHVGAVVSDDVAWGGQAVRAAPGSDQPGHIGYGPWALFTPNRYEACWRLSYGGEASGEVATVDVFAYELPELVSRTVRGDDFSAVGRYQEFCLPFRNPRHQPLQFRVYYTGRATLAFDGVTVRPVQAGG